MHPREIRIANMNEIIHTMFHGSIRAFAEKAMPGRKIKTAESYISQIRGGHKPLTEKMAAQIEEALTLPDGYLSRKPSTQDPVVRQVGINDFTILEKAITQIMDQFVSAGLYKPQLNTQPELFAAFTISRFKELMIENNIEVESQRPCDQSI